MERVGFDLSFDIHGPNDAGTLVALCQQLPMIIAANSESELRRRVVAALEGLPLMLERVSASEGIRFLEGEGVSLQRLPEGATPGTRTITLPVLLSA